MEPSERKHEAVEVAARPLRELLVEEHDEIAAAQRALRQAERKHDLAIGLAERQLRAAKTAEPLDSYGHELILYADRLSTAEGNHALTSDVRAHIEEANGARSGARGRGGRLAPRGLVPPPRPAQGTPPGR